MQGGLGAGEGNLKRAQRQKRNFLLYEAIKVYVLPAHPLKRSRLLLLLVASCSPSASSPSLNHALLKARYLFPQSLFNGAAKGMVGMHQMRGRRVGKAGGSEQQQGKQLKAKQQLGKQRVTPKHHQPRQQSKKGDTMQQQVGPTLNVGSSREGTSCSRPRASNAWRVQLWSGLEQHHASHFEMVGDANAVLLQAVPQPCRSKLSNSSPLGPASLHNQPEFSPYSTTKSALNLLAAEVTGSASTPTRFTSHGGVPTADASTPLHLHPLQASAAIRLSLSACEAIASSTALLETARQLNAHLTLPANSNTSAAPTPRSIPNEFKASRHHAPSPIPLKQLSPKQQQQDQQQMSSMQQQQQQQQDHQQIGYIQPHDHSVNTISPQHGSSVTMISPQHDRSVNTISPQHDRSANMISPQHDHSINMISPQHARSLTIPITPSHEQIALAVLSFLDPILSRAKALAKLLEADVAESYAAKTTPAATPAAGSTVKAIPTTPVKAPPLLPSSPSAAASNKGQPVTPAYAAGSQHLGSRSALRLGVHATRGRAGRTGGAGDATPHYSPGPEAPTYPPTASAASKKDSSSNKSAGTSNVSNKSWREQVGWGGQETSRLGGAALGTARRRLDQGLGFAFGSKQLDKARSRGSTVELGSRLRQAHTKPARGAGSTPTRSAPSQKASLNGSSPGPKSTEEGAPTSNADTGAMAGLGNQGPASNTGSSAKQECQHFYCQKCWRQGAGQALRCTQEQCQRHK